MRLPPPPDVAVLDANGIIGLAKGDCLHLLEGFFREVYAPPEVLAEVTDPVSSAALNRALAVWLIERSPAAASLAQVPDLGGGADQAVLALAWEIRNCLIVSGDTRLARAARRCGLRSQTAPQVVLSLADAGLVVRARPHLDRMRQHGFGITDEMYRSILEQLGEL